MFSTCVFSTSFLDLWKLFGSCTRGKIPPSLASGFCKSNTILVVHIFLLLYFQERCCSKFIWEVEGCATLPWWEEGGKITHNMNYFCWVTCALPLAALCLFILPSAKELVQVHENPLVIKETMVRESIFPYLSRNYQINPPWHAAQHVKWLAQPMFHEGAFKKWASPR